MKKIIFGLLLSMCLLSCEKQLSYDLPEGENNIVVNSILNANADTILVNLSLSKPTAEPLDTNLFINDAQVDFYENNQLISSLQPWGTKGYYHTNYQVRSGYTYSLKVKYNEFEAQANTTLPDKPNFSSRILDPNGTLIIGEITIHDDADKSNYYIIGVQHNDTAYNDTSFAIVRKNALRFIFADFGPIEAKLYGIVDGYAFSDQIFDGQTYSFKWYAKAGIDTLFVRLFTIDKNLFEFFKTFSLSEIANANPFAQPANVYTNIDGGLGLFASLNYIEDTLEVNYIIIFK